MRREGRQKEYGISDLQARIFFIMFRQKGYSYKVYCRCSWRHMRGICVQSERQLFAWEADLNGQIEVAIIYPGMMFYLHCRLSRCLEMSSNGLCLFVFRWARFAYLSAHIQVSFRLPREGQAQDVHLWGPSSGAGTLTCFLRLSLGFSQTFSGFH